MFLSIVVYISYKEKHTQDQSSSFCGAGSRHRRAPSVTHLKPTKRPNRRKPHFPSPSGSSSPLHNPSLPHASSFFNVSPLPTLNSQTHTISPHQKNVFNHHDHQRHISRYSKPFSPSFFFIIIITAKTPTPLPHHLRLPQTRHERRSISRIYDTEPR